MTELQPPSLLCLLWVSGMMTTVFLIPKQRHRGGEGEHRQGSRHGGHL